MRTIKLPYTSNNSDTILKYQANQNNIIRFIYNRLLDNLSLSQKELTELANSMNNIFVDSWLKQSAIYKAKEIYEKNQGAKVIFGGKYLFLKRINNLVTKEEFQAARLLPLVSIGEASKLGNRKLNFDLANNQLILKLTKDLHIELKLPSIRKKLFNILLKLEELAKSKTIPIMLQISKDCLYITYDEVVFTSPRLNFIDNRFIAIDMNPNYIGYSISDWSNAGYKLVDKGVISIKTINDKAFNLKRLKYELKAQGLEGSERADIIRDKLVKVTNKRDYEIIHIADKLVALARHYKVEKFVIENIKMAGSDRGKGKRFNRLVNNCWNRNLLEDQLAKRLKLANIELKYMICRYSSQVGNLAYRDTKLPDMVLSSIEISRRGFVAKQIDELKLPISKGEICQPSKYLAAAIKSLEEFKSRTASTIRSWADVFKHIKDSKLSYRVSLESIKSEVFSLSNRKSLIGLYSFI